MIKKRFAFLIHPRTEVSKDLAKAYGLGILKFIPNGLIEWGMKHFFQKPLITGEFKDPESQETLGYIITVPLSGKQFFSLPRKEVLARVSKAVDLAVSKGVQVVGLGALTSSATNGGKALLPREDVVITNGNAYTAFATLRLFEKLLTAKPKTGEVAIVGASGSVGVCLTELIHRRYPDLGLKLVARNLSRLEKVKGRLKGGNAPISISNDIQSITSADIVVVLTSSNENLLAGVDLKPGALILDDTQPRNTSPALLKERPDLRIIDGGLIDLDGNHFKGFIGLPEQKIYACLAETILLGLEGYEDHFSIGRTELKKAEQTGQWAEKYAHIGFDVSALHSFGEPLPCDHPAELEGVCL
jgi:fatty aldehyde-generating acyl-ACP reductase